jgi:hypothetical protein
MIVNSISDQEQQPEPNVPVSDPRAQASSLEDMPDPYAEAARRRELAGSSSR